jgi:hypothetical protein
MKPRKRRNTYTYPRADSSSRYHALLKESAISYPRVTDALMRADRHRPRRWQQFIDPIDLQATDRLLEFLTSVSRSLEEDGETSDLAFLADRVADDVRISLEGLLSGYLQVASDAMRDIMETELLIRDFALDPNQISKWRTADANVLRRSFRPVHLRQRQADALGVDIGNVPGASDYSAHSKLLHVGEPLLFSRTPESGAMAGHRAIHVLESLADIMYHGSSAVQALDLFLNATNRSGPDPKRALDALACASDDLSSAMAAVEAMERLAAESLSADENPTVMLFESGLVLVINRAATTGRLYRTDGIDFRTFHRSVSDDQPGVINLIAVGDEMKAQDP